MKVLFLTYPRIGLNRGGLQIQIEETAKGLSEFGVEVVYYDAWTNQIPHIDLCHVFSMDSAMLHHVEQAAQLKKPVVISPVFSAFEHGSLLTSLKVRLSKHVPGMYSDLKRAAKMIALATTIIALNAEEGSLLKKAFPLASRKVRLVPNGIDLGFAEGVPAKFIQRYGLTNFVLTVGSIEPNKNQLLLIRALKPLHLPLVIIGKIHTNHRKYYEQCREEGGSNVHYLGELSHGDPLLSSAYAAAGLFVLPSISEVMPLSLYEAAVSGCKVIASHSFPIHPALEPYIRRFSPQNVAALSALVDQQMKSVKDLEIEKIVRTMPSWVDVSRRIQETYAELLSRG